MSNMNSSSGTSVSDTELLFTVINIVSVLVCLLAASLVFVFKLYLKLVYRLALYQVLASLSFATVDVCQILFINYKKNSLVYGRVCTAVGWLFMYTQWMKLLFTMWVIVHLFCFGVLHKIMKRFEVMYVVTSLLVPAAIASLPLITHSYGLAPKGTVCLIISNEGNDNNTAVIERLVLWDAPAISILLIGSAAMSVTVIKLTRQVCSRLKYEQITDNDPFSKAVKHLLPLAAFPMIFFFLLIPPLSYDLYSYSTGHVPPIAVTIASLACISMWSMTSGLTLIIHIAVARQVWKRKSVRRLASNTRGNDLLQLKVSSKDTCENSL